MSNFQNKPATVLYQLGRAGGRKLRRSRLKKKRGKAWTKAIDLLRESPWIDDMNDINWFMDAFFTH